MADNPSHERLPIKLILPNQGKQRRVPAGGKKKLFRPVTDEYRQSLARQVSAIREAVTPAMERVGSAPLRVKLLPTAFAKSHRPESLFSSSTCPIVSSGSLGELFVKGTPGGLKSLESQIKDNVSERMTKELSSVDAIEPVTPSLRRHNVAAFEILKNSPRRSGTFLTRVRLFDFGGDPAQLQLVADFESACQRRNIPFKRGAYSSYTYEARCRTVEDVDALSRTIGVRSIRQMPLIRMLRPQVMNVSALPENLSRPKDLSGDYPIVAVVDSGIAEIPAMEPWVLARQRDVPPVYRNTTHGTFVAGLICWGTQLNQDLADMIDPNPCGVFDLHVIPNTDPDYCEGNIDFLTEEELLQSLSAALTEHANRIKVWNLSLGSDEVCSLDNFSPLAEELDKLQESFQVTFVISAGNYERVPMLDYPRTGQQLRDGRITSPADSVLGVTVGAISHVNYRNLGPGTHCPTPFSRHGAGPNYIIKPDFVHFGGTCTTDFSHRAGIRSITEGGAAEDIGTSFATPLVARALAQVHHHITPSPSPVLARALLTHHAKDPRTKGRVPDQEENYFGFGMPTSVPYCLECTPHCSTLVFEDQLRPGFFLEWADFPYPPSLKRDGRYYGEIAMTVAFAPSRSGRFGTEYCETHIEAHFGVYDERVNRSTGEVTKHFKGRVPPEHKNAGAMYEEQQIRELRKWAPVRTYFGNLNPSGARGLSWRLVLRLLTRHGVEARESFRPQPFAMIITIADPEKRAPVYDEMAQIVRTRFQAENMTVRAAARIRPRAEQRRRLGSTAGAGL